MKAKDNSEIMDMGKALEIVLEMAKSLYHSHGEFCKPAQCPADATIAMDTVEDFIANNFGDDENNDKEATDESK